MHRRLPTPLLLPLLVVLSACPADSDAKPLAKVAEGAAERTAQALADRAGPVVLPGPSFEDPWPFPTASEALKGKTVPAAANPDVEVAMATNFDAVVFNRVRSGRYHIGTIRRGTTLPIVGQVEDKRCSKGRWIELEGGGFICEGLGFRVEKSPAPEDQREPDLSSPLPYRYASVKKGQPVLRLTALPTKKQLENLEGSGLVQEVMEGDYFVGIDRVEEVAGRRFVRTIRGHYVEEKYLEELPPSAMHGELLEEGGMTLPIAFVLDPEVPLWCLGSDAEVCGHAEKHARFKVLGQREVDGVTLIRGEKYGVDTKHVRVAREIPRPDHIPAGAKWVHFDLAEQTMVAYEGDRPVMATLISSGRDPFRTPTGDWKTDRLYLTKTMRGKDPVDGIYDVEEVPWVLFYFRGYAAHGAYWHNDFGRVRSHGCTNLAPLDARWLYEWSSHQAPELWHATFLGAGMSVHFTNEAHEAVAGSTGTDVGS